MLLIGAASCWIASNIWDKKQSSFIKVELHKGQFKLPESVQNHHMQYLAQLTLRSIWYSSLGCLKIAYVCPLQVHEHQENHTCNIT